ncbi:heterodisulfide reductase-related iron-sulfur binding cluster [uncultured Selenomonas sp.]|uniref:heterodisulfide reductase-related iron-sulfur binding cluster n=1 Tax=uncultured Selenomonas sp. TaxID=159275 RepID=UPI0025F71389|nr:heterodisulfide reductase-related iron-sulfur binding cluster [uncultured Selenomonas sp.]
MDAVREFLPFLPAGAGMIIYPLSILFFGCMAYGLYWRFQRYGVSLKDAWEEVKLDAKTEGRARLRTVIEQALLQKKVMRRPLAGNFHWGIFGAMLVFSAGTGLVAFQQDLLSKLGLTFLKNGVYFAFEFVLDTAALAFLAGLLVALGRRMFAKPSYLENTKESYAVLGLLLFIGATGLLLEGMRLAAHPVPWGGWSYVGSLVAQIVPAAAVPAVYPYVWWTHLFAALTMIALVPYTKLYHILAIPANLFLEPVGVAKAKLSMPFNLMDMAEDESEESEEEEPTMGVGNVQEFDWKRKFAVDACINCGRCESVCPAVAAGRELSPRVMIQGLKASIAATVPAPGLMKKAEASDLILDEKDAMAGEKTGNVFEDGILSEEAAWSCLNCGACMEECPASIHHVEYTLDFRRHLFSEGHVKDKQATLLEAVERNGNPYGLPSYERTEWLLDKGIPDIEDNPDADYIYWIGCAGAYGIRNQEVTLATLRLLKAAGLNFAILAEEKCCGEVVKRLGEEGRFQLLAMENVQYLEPYADKTFITSCPHCYNTLKHEYRDFGLELNVVHHTELFAKLLADGKLPLAANDAKLAHIAYHDPCNLGRMNGIYDAPREVIGHVPGATLVEPARHGDRSFCCGAGGGNAWFNVPEKTKVSSLRLKEICASAHPAILAVACPYCLAMFDDAVKTEGMEKTLAVKDISELLADALPISDESGETGGDVAAAP